MKNVNVLILCVRFIINYEKDEIKFRPNEKKTHLFLWTIFFKVNFKVLIHNNVNVYEV